MVPPASRPLLGQTLVTLIGVKNVYVNDPPHANPWLTNFTSTFDSAADVGALHKAREDDNTIEGVWVNPKEQEEPLDPAINPLPTIVTLDPPIEDPTDGTSCKKTHDSPNWNKTVRPVKSRMPLLLNPTLTMPALCRAAKQVTIVDDMKRPREVEFIPKKQLSSAVCTKCFPTTVTTWPTAPAWPRDGSTASTVAPIS